MRKKGLVLLLLFFSCSAIAANEDFDVFRDRTKDGHGPWDAQAELGTIINAGNSNSTNFKGKLILEYTTPKWYDKIKLETQYGTNEGDLTEERLSGQLETRYLFLPKTYAVTILSASKQKFKPYEYVFSESLGIGRRIFAMERFILDIQAGPGGRHSVDNDADQKINEFIIESGLIAHWKITEVATFTEEIESRSGESNNFVKATSSVQTKFVGHLGLKFAFEVEYNSTLPADSSKTKHFDSTTSVTMVYDF